MDGASRTKYDGKVAAARVERRIFSVRERVGESADPVDVDQRLDSVEEVGAMTTRAAYLRGVPQAPESDPEILKDRPAAA